MKLTLLITFLNEEKMIEKTHREVKTVLESMLPHELSDYELLYIDDGSTDATLPLIEKIAEQDYRVRYVSFSRNFGREEESLPAFAMPQEMRS